VFGLALTRLEEATDAAFRFTTALEVVGWLALLLLTVAGPEIPLARANCEPPGLPTALAAAVRLFAPLLQALARPATWLLRDGAALAGLALTCAVAG
jgi:hypothetical protein